MKNMNKPYTTVKREEIYKGVIIEVVKDTITLPNGKQAYREMVLHNGAAAIVPIDQDGNILFVRQYRHPAQEEILEIPAGTLEIGEDPLQCAKRELEEETGFTAQKFSLLSAMYTAIGFCTEKIYIYLAEGLQEGAQNLDEDEFVTVERYSLEESVQLIVNGTIKDSKTIAGIFAAKQLLENIQSSI